MTAIKPFAAGRLLKTAGSAVLLAFLAAIAGGIHLHTRDPRTAEQTLRSAWPELATYLVGYGFAITLTVTAFALVHWHWTTPYTALWIVLGLGLVQIIVHFRCFLHINLRTQRATIFSSFCSRR